MHRLLKRQLKKLFGDNPSFTPEIDRFIHLVSDSYQEFQDDYYKLERILELSAKDSFRELNNFKNAIEAAALVSLTDANANIIYANDNFCEISGFSLGELIGQNHNIVNSGYHPKSFWEQMWATLKAGKIWKGEIRNRKKDGSFYWVDSTIIPFLSESGVPYEFLSIRFDVTERKHIEDEISKLALVAQKTQNAVIITDLERKAIWANEGFERITGFPVVELLGKVPGHLLQGEGTDPNTIKEISKALKAKKPYTGEILNYSKQGRPYWIFLSITPILEAGALKGFLAVETDITERKNFEEQLRQSEERFRLLIESATDIFYTSDRLGNFTYVNDIATRITEYSREELLSMNYLDLVHPDHRAEVAEFYVAQGTSRIPVSYREFTILTRTGKTVWVGQNLQLIKSGPDDFFIQAIARDITTQKQAEQKVLESENRFRSLVQNSNDITTILSAEGSVTYESPNFYTLFGYSEAETLGLPIFSFIHPEDVEQVMLEFRKGIERGGVSDLIEFRFRKKNGDYVYIEAIGNNLLHEPGINGIVINSRDISERKKAQEEISNLKEFYENVLNKIPTDVVVFDKDHRYVFVNEMAVTDPERRKWLIGHNDTEYCINFGKDIRIAEERKIPFQTALQTREQYEFEEVLKNVKGELHYIIRRFYPIQDHSGEVTHVIGFGMDITRRKLAEQKILESEERLKLATDSAHLGVFDFDLLNNRLVWDDSMFRLFEANPSEFDFTPASFERFLHPEDKQRVMQNIQNLMNEGSEIKDLYRIKTGHGKERYLSSSAKIYRNKEGQPTRMIGVNFDVTEEKEAERLMEQYLHELEKKNKELDQFAYIVSHDLKAPLRGINNLSQWIEEDLEGKLDADTQNNLNLMRKRVFRMENLIDGILQYSRAGRIHHEIVHLHLTENLSELILNLSPPERFSIITDTELPELETERIALEQVFSNYISNAIKYNNNPQPEIHIGHRKNGDYFDFYVRDNGPGIDPAHFEKVFVIFQTLQSKDTFESTGVGLAIVKKIVEDKGGKVWVESTPGEGSTFWFSWPMKEERVNA